MLFCSKEFAFFFLAVFALYWVLPWQRARVWLLLVASFGFYGSWNWMLAILICISTAIDYGIARGMDAWRAEVPRRLLLAGSLIMNLGLLCYFKYANFFLQSVEEAVRSLGATASFPVLQIVLPIGISFYTFEAINYTVDVYRRRIRAERNFAHFMLFILFFPHLIAGPIVRAHDFLPQIARRKRWDWARLQLGVQFFLMGLFKKWAIADRMALFCDPVFQAPERYSSSAVWLATLAFALRIYCDFSGYTDMALGSAHMLGYKLAQNFNMPYLAVNFSDFWHRWHISLSSWLRDYLFIPLGGSRGGPWKTCRNLLLTMTLGGLWHGVSWMFVLWGFLHGVFLILHRGFRAFCRARPWLDHLLQTGPGTALRLGVTFLGVCLGWVFFYTASIEAEKTLTWVAQVAAGETVAASSYSALHASGVILQRLFIPHPGQGIDPHNRGLWYTVLVVVLAHALAAGNRWKKLAVRLPAPVMGFGYAVLLTFALLLAPDTGRAFLYFRF